MENGSHTSALGANSSDTPSLGHKRSLSGPGGILSRLPFLRPSSSFEESTRPALAHANGGPRTYKPRQEQEPEPSASAMAAAVQVQKTGRKRKGSLRKTALLGTGKFKLERRSSGLDRHKEMDAPSSPTRSRTASQYSREQRRPSDDSADAETTSRQRFSFEDDTTLADSETTESSDPTLQHQRGQNGLMLDLGDKSDGSAVSPPTVHSGRVNNVRYASTTDDDDGLTFSTTSVVSNDLVRRKSSRSTHTSSLPHSTPAPVVIVRETPPEHDYATTAFWGWIILIIVWIVFVVGMGSCLGVWSWAWDVGETPSAPQDLEDDMTLPIVGYYPALIVMTGVMAWVWVVFAWVGMKYFRHARYGEE